MQVGHYCNKSLVLTTTLAFPAAQIGSTFIHEVLGHGLAAVLTGGNFYAFFINIFGGRAYLWIPSDAEAWQQTFVYGAGIGSNLLAYVLFLLLLKRCKHRNISAFLLMNAGCNGLSAALYVSLDPVLLIIGYPEGDIAHMLSGQQWAALPTSACGLIIGVLMVRGFYRRILWLLGNANNPSVTAGWASLAFFVGPGVLLNVGALAIAWQFLSTFYAQSSAIALVLFLALLAVGVSTLLRPGAACTESRQPLTREWAYLNKAMLVSLAAVTGYFGPTDQLAHNVILQQPSSELFPGYAVKLELQVNLRSAAEAEVGICATSVARNGSPLEHRLSYYLNLVGPDSAKNTQVQIGLADMFPGLTAYPLGKAELTGGCWLSLIKVELKESAIFTSTGSRVKVFRLSIPENGRSVLESAKVQVAPEAFKIRSTNGIVNGNVARWSKEQLGQDWSKLELYLESI